MSPAILKSGALSAPGGYRRGAGRTPDWLKEKCRNIVDKKKLVEFLADVATGEDIDQVVAEDGTTLKVPAAIKERLKAVEMLLNRGFGRVEDFHTQQAPADAVKNVEMAMSVLRLIEEAKRNADRHSGAGGDPLRMADRPIGLQTKSPAAHGL